MFARWINVLWSLESRFCGFEKSSASIFPDEELTSFVHCSRWCEKSNKDSSGWRQKALPLHDRPKIIGTTVSRQHKTVAWCHLELRYCFSPFHLIRICRLSTWMSPYCSRHIHNANRFIVSRNVCQKYKILSLKWDAWCHCVRSFSRSIIGARCFDFSQSWNNSNVNSSGDANVW